MRSLNKLTASEVKHARKGQALRRCGLWLYKQDDGGGKWVLRVTAHGRRREMGLGSLQNVTLKQARKEAAKWRALAAKGVDPIKERQRLARTAERNLHLLPDVAVDAFKSRKAELKGEGTAGRWFSPLNIHVLPKLGEVPVSQLDQVDIRDTLAPIWHEKASTAAKAMDRLGIVLKHAAALGLDVDLQATTKARAPLGAQRHRVTSIPSMPWQDVPGFYDSLGDGVTELALRLLILTATRSAPVRFASLDDFDLENGIWTIPAEHMKGREAKTENFRVPLPGEAVRVVKLASPFGRDGLLFPGRTGPMSDMTMSKLMRDRGLEFRPHGFRSSFRTWAEDNRAAPYEVCETALGHTVGNKVERSYQRSDLLEQRRALMDRWATHVTAGSGKEAARSPQTGQELVCRFVGRGVKPEKPPRSPCRRVRLTCDEHALSGQRAGPARGSPARPGTGTGAPGFEWPGTHGPVCALSLQRHRNGGLQMERQIADRTARHGASTQDRSGRHAHGRPGYGRFLTMIGTSTVVMFGLMYLNTYALDHVFFSRTRMWMALYMGGAMAVIMLAFMLGMYSDRRTNRAIFVGAALAFILGVGMVRSQATVADIAWMKAMIPHHSIAILTSERAHISDPRVRALADAIIEAQRGEIEEMKRYIADIEANGDAPPGTPRSLSP